MEHDSWKMEVGFYPEDRLDVLDEEIKQWVLDQEMEAWEEQQEPDWEMRRDDGVQGNTDTSV